MDPDPDPGSGSSYLHIEILHDGGGIRIRIRGGIRTRIHTFDWWIGVRIRESRKHVDSGDPDTNSDPDPQHWPPDMGGGDPYPSLP